MVIDLTPGERELLHSIVLGTMRIALKQDDDQLVKHLQKLLEKLK